MFSGPPCEARYLPVVSFHRKWCARAWPLYCPAGAESTQSPRKTVSAPAALARISSMRLVLGPKDLKAVCGTLDQIHDGNNQDTLRKGKEAAASVGQFSAPHFAWSPTICAVISSRTRQDSILLPQPERNLHGLPTAAGTVRHRATPSHSLSLSLSLSFSLSLSLSLFRGRKRI